MRQRQEAQIQHVKIHTASHLIVGVAIPHAQAQNIAEGQGGTKVLGVLGEEEEIGILTLMYRPLLRIDLEEHVQRSSGCGRVAVITGCSRPRSGLSRG